MKLLDATLIGILAGMSASASAQQAEPAKAAIECGDEACSSETGELVFRVRTRSYDQPATTGTDAQSSSEALQPDRRVSVALDQPGRAVARGTFSVQLPGGGAIWATEDPDLGVPELSITAPSMVAFDAGRIVEPVRLFVRSNYTAFVDRYELRIYRGSDGDLVAPVASLDLPVEAAVQSEWNGELPADLRLRAGDELVYVLRAFDAQGNFDETSPRKLQLVRPDEAERARGQVRESVERSLGTALSGDQALTQQLVEDAFAGNGLRQQNIPIYGSRVRVQGRNLPEGRSLRINGESYPVDLERKFVAEYLVPVGQHRFEIGLDGQDGAAPIVHALDVDVSGRYFFGVAMADVTVYQNDASGPGQSLAMAGREDDILSDGRLAFYGKAKLGGKYLVTAQADTQNRPLEDLFDGFTSADPQDVFRRLDPDLYYPTYGDDSRVWRDVDTMGRFYLRADWDKNEALWGNFATGFTGTEYGQYSRALYGAALNWRSRMANAWGDPVTQLRAFASEAQTAPGHSEFIGTGGSLYYLRHTDVLPGSDRVVLEVRDRTTGRVEQRVELLRGADYEIDELQGRVLLTRPLAQITLQNLPTLTRDAPLDGFAQRLIVDYEWVPSDFDADDVAAGVRGKHWFGDHLGVGLTHVDENRAGEDYTLTSADVTLQAGKGTYLKLEHARTESTSAPVFFSDNGGLSFTRINPAGPREGEATAVEARANFQELGWSQQPWSAGAWWRQIDAGYSISRFDTGAEVEEYGAEVLGEFTPNLGVYARYSRAERAGDVLTQAQARAEWRIGDVDALAFELRRVEETRGTLDAAGLLGAARYTRRFGTALDVYGTAQLTLDDDSGAYADNDAFTLGGRYNFANLSTLGGELTTGDRGDAAQINGEWRRSAQQSFYGSYTYSTDRSDYDPLFNPNARNGWTLGQRWRLSNQVNVFNESQFLKNRRESGLAHTFGLDFYPAQGWNVGFTLSDGELTNVNGGEVDRRAISVAGGRTSTDTSWQSKLEWREDSGAERVTQWVSTHRLTHKLNESWRIAGRFNYADTQDDLDPAASAKFIEGNLGFAFRPWNSTRWGLFGRYTYLYDLATLGQMGGAQYDQKTQVLSLEGVYRHDQRWEFAGKLARREGEARFGRGTGDWFDSATTFAAGQVRYELLYRWHAMAEYRWLDVDDGGTRQGWMAGVDRDIGRNFRIGAGYNFTDFSDDLTEFDYDHQGWFVNFVGSY
ncbi:TonB-dependent receptor [Luteimonas viscosa]|uniref:TonB-dependent receptor n=1 Tax=Luteimonas viscosa TaxID=1132694 RepID=A0A5D4XSG9_9GAMM|nr:TonB-dependent receptor [Luteimonas viscosa]TYT27529.1 TonB-dependent receptor [Luteimonas viscosa]